MPRLANLYSERPVGRDITLYPFPSLSPSPFLPSRTPETLKLPEVFTDRFRWLGDYRLIADDSLGLRSRPLRELSCYFLLQQLQTPWSSSLKHLFTSSRRNQLTFKSATT